MHSGTIKTKADLGRLVRVALFGSPTVQLASQPRSQGLTSYRPLGRARRGRLDERPWERGWLICIV